MGSAQIQGELWGKAPRDWTYLQEPMHIPVWEAMLDAAQVGAGTRLLDAGCGGGGASVLAHQRGARVSGLDAAEPLIQLAAERVPAGDFRIGDLEHLPFDDGTFDVIFAANAIQFAADQLAALREMRRVCVPGGKLVAGTFCTADKVESSAVFRAIASSLPESLPKGNPLALSVPGAMEDALERGGFRVTGRDEVNCPFEYADFDTLWKALGSGGPVQSALHWVSAEVLRENIQRAMEPYQRADGSFYTNNMFFYVTAEYA